MTPIIAFLFCAWQHVTEPADEEKRPQAAASAAPSGDYVGSETRRTCHEDMPSKGFYKNFEGSPHFVTTLDTKQGPEWHGCEACHGPGKAYVEAGGDKTKISAFKGASASEVSQRCLGCHQYGDEHSNYARSVDLQNGVSCTALVRSPAGNPFHSAFALLHGDLRSAGLPDGYCLARG